MICSCLKCYFVASYKWMFVDTMLRVSGYDKRDVLDLSCH